MRAVLHLVDAPAEATHGITAFAQILSDASERLGVPGQVMDARHFLASEKRFGKEPYLVVLHYEPGCMSAGLERRLFNRFRISSSFVRCASYLHRRVGYTAVVHESPWPRRRGWLARCNVLLDLTGLRHARRLLTASHKVGKSLTASCGVGCTVLPVFSNIPDPNTRDLEKLKEDMVVLFGSNVAISRFLNSAHWWKERFLSLPVRSVGIVTPYLQTSQRKACETMFSGWDTRFYLGLSLLGVGSVLARARYGVMDYAQAENSPDCFSKSGVLAAYLQHGVTPIIHGEAGTMFLYSATDAQAFQAVDNVRNIDVVPGSVLQRHYRLTRSPLVYAETLLQTGGSGDGQICWGPERID